MKRPMKKEQADQWAKTREKGRWHFIFVWGVLFWGGVTAILWSVFMSVFSDQGFVGVVKVALPIFMIGGFVWGLLMWTGANRLYKKYLATQDETP